MHSLWFPSSKITLSTGVESNVLIIHTVRQVLDQEFEAIDRPRWSNYGHRLWNFETMQLLRIMIVIEMCPFPIGCTHLVEYRKHYQFLETLTAPVSFIQPNVNSRQYECDCGCCCCTVLQFVPSAIGPQSLDLHESERARAHAYGRVCGWQFYRFTMDDYHQFAVLDNVWYANVRNTITAKINMELTNKQTNNINDSVGRWIFNWLR